MKKFKTSNRYDIRKKVLREYIDFNKEKDKPLHDFGGKFEWAGKVWEGGKKSSDVAERVAVGRYYKGNTRAAISEAIKMQLLPSSALRDFDRLAVKNKTIKTYAVNKSPDLSVDVSERYQTQKSLAPRMNRGQQPDSRITTQATDASKYNETLKAKIESGFKKYWWVGVGVLLGSKKVRRKIGLK